MVAHSGGRSEPVGHDGNEAAPSLQSAKCSLKMPNGRKIIDAAAERRGRPLYLAAREYLRGREHSLVHEREMRKKGTIVDEDGTQAFSNHVIEFLRLWCEGHNLEMQDLLRVQEDNKKEINLIDQVCSLTSTIACDASRVPGAPAGGLGVGSQLRPRTTTSTSELGRSRPVRHEP